MSAATKLAGEPVTVCAMYLFGVVEEWRLAVLLLAAGWLEGDAFAVVFVAVLLLAAGRLVGRAAAGCWLVCWWCWLLASGLEH